MSSNFIGSQIAIITKSQCRYTGTIIGKKKTSGKKQDDVLLQGSMHQHLRSFSGMLNVLERKIEVEIS